jgi:uncharacterized protein (DUF58 family)
MKAEIQPTFDPASFDEGLESIHANIPVRELVMDGTVFGDIVSLRKGNGHVKDGPREYTPEDNIRDIDWRLTTRQTDRRSLMIRTRQKDISPNLWVVSDVLQRRYGELRTDQYHTEQRLGLSAIMGLMQVAESIGMPSTVIAADDHDVIDLARHPVLGRNHIYKAAEMLAESALEASDYDESSKLGLSDVIDHAAKKGRKGIVAVVSDFRDEKLIDGKEFTWQEPLEQLKSQGNHILAVELVDPHDFFLRDSVDRFVDNKNHQVHWVGESQSVRRDYEKRAIAKSAAIKEALSDLDASHIRLMTDNGMWRDSFVSQLNTGETASLPVLKIQEDSQKRSGLSNFIAKIAK